MSVELSGMFLFLFLLDGSFFQNVPCSRYFFESRFVFFYLSILASMDDRRDRRTGVSMLTSRVSHLVKFCTGRYMLRLYVILEIPAQNKVVGKPYGTVLPHRRGIDSVPNFSVSISKSGFRLPFQTIFHFQTVWKCWEMEMENQRRRTGTRSYVYLWYCQMCSQSHARTCTTTRYGGFYSICTRANVMRA
jgi:hypothetical protein